MIRFYRVENGVVFFGSVKINVGAKETSAVCLGFSFGFSFGTEGIPLNAVEGFKAVNSGQLPPKVVGH